MSRLAALLTLALAGAASAADPTVVYLHPEGGKAGPFHLHTPGGEVHLYITQDAPPAPAPAAQPEPKPLPPQWSVPAPAQPEQLKNPPPPPTADAGPQPSPRTAPTALPTDEELRLDAIRRIVARAG